MTNTSSKRVNIVSIKMVKESSILYKNRQILSPKDSVNLLKDFINDSDREMLIVCCLDTKNQPTCISIVSIGTINSSLVHPREVFKTAILSNSASIIMAHNHPTGDPEPSYDDLMVTKMIKTASDLVGLHFHDHIVIGDHTYYSFNEHGELSSREEI